MIFVAGLPSAEGIAWRAVVIAPASRGGLREVKKTGAAVSGRTGLNICDAIDNVFPIHCGRNPGSIPGDITGAIAGISVYAGALDVIQMRGKIPGVIPKRGEEILSQ